jgi:hypothetical protein
LNGIKTTVKRISTSTATIDVKPDLVNSAQTLTKDVNTTIRLRNSQYLPSPDESGPYQLKESMQVPLLFTDAAVIEDYVGKYEFYLKNFVIGDALGLQVGEAMRPEIINNWRPGMPFRFVDTSNNKVIAMRMDQCSWAVSESESVVVFAGVYIGESDGTYSSTRNLTGDSRPDVGSGTTPPAAQDPPPAITGETNVNAGSVYFDVEVDLSMQHLMSFPGGDGVIPVNPTDLSVDNLTTFVIFVSGVTVQAGGVLSAEGNGSIPIENNGNLITIGATVLDSDLFTA